MLLCVSLCYCMLTPCSFSCRSVLLNIPGLLIVNILACLVGLVMYAYYAQVGCDPLRMKYISNSNQVLILQTRHSVSCNAGRHPVFQHQKVATLEYFHFSYSKSTCP